MKSTPISSKAVKDQFKRNYSKDKIVIFLHANTINDKVNELTRIGVNNQQWDTSVKEMCEGYAEVLGDKDSDEVFWEWHNNHSLQYFIMEFEDKEEAKEKLLSMHSNKPDYADLWVDGRFVDENT